MIATIKGGSFDINVPSDPQLELILEYLQRLEKKMDQSTIDLQAARADERAAHTALFARIDALLKTLGANPDAAAVAAVTADIRTEIAAVQAFHAANPITPPAGP